MTGAQLSELKAVLRGVTVDRIAAYVPGNTRYRPIYVGTVSHDNMDNVLVVVKNGKVVDVIEGELTGI